MKQCDIYSDGKRCNCTATHEIVFRGFHYGELRIMNVCENDLQKTCEKLKLEENIVEDVYPLSVIA